MSVKWLGPMGNPIGPNYREVKVVTSVMSLLETIMVTAVPDAVVEVLDSKLRIKPDQSSYLLCKYSFKGTQVSKINPRVGTSTELFVDNTKVLSPGLDQKDREQEQTQLQQLQQDPRQPLKRQRVHNGNTADGAVDVAASNTTTNNNSNNNNEVEEEQDDNRSIISDITSSDQLAQKPWSRSSSSNALSSSKTAGLPPPPPPGAAAATATAVAPSKGKQQDGKWNSGPVYENVRFGSTESLQDVIQMDIIGTLIVHIQPDKKITKFEYIRPPVSNYCRRYLRILINSRIYTQSFLLMA
mmetsp:Transcript_27796/g.46694  ORF Transcript_27796/g.46694 Transcript_27796/m.46694 type:complete len:298 (-) Transcript_27796:598-1491(-)